MIAFLQDGIEPEDPEQRRQTVELADIKEYEAEDGILYRKMRNSPSSPEYRVPFVATPNRRHFLEHYHKAFGHWSYPAIEGITRARGWWPQMAKDLKDFSNSCRECQLAQRPRPRLERDLPHSRRGISVGAAVPLAVWERGTGSRSAGCNEQAGGEVNKSERSHISCRPYPKQQLKLSPTFSMKRYIASSAPRRNSSLTMVRISQQPSPITSTLV